MTDAATLLDRLRAAGVELGVDGEKLILDGPVDALPDELVALARQLKAEVMALVRRGMTKHERLMLAGDAAQRIHEHCAICKACPEPAAFATIIAPIGCCETGRTLWRRYRDARAAALEVN